MYKLSEEEVQNTINYLLQEARTEMKQYNWVGTLKILNDAEKICTENNLSELKIEILYQLGEIYFINAHFEKVKKTVIQNFKNSIKSFQNILKIYKKRGFKPKLNECRGFLKYIKYISGSGTKKDGNLLDSAKNYFKNAAVAYKRKKNRIETLEMQILECGALNLQIGEKLIQNDETTELKKIIDKFKKNLVTIWKKIEKTPKFPEFYIFYFLKTISDFLSWIIAYYPIDKLNIDRFILDNINLLKEITVFCESKKLDLSLFFSYTIISFLNLSYARYYAENQFKQKKFLKTCQNWLKRGEKIISKVKFNQALALFFYTRYTTAFALTDLGFFAKDFKKALVDLHASIAVGSISYPRISIAHLLLNFSAAFLDIAFSRFTPDHLRVEFAKEALNVTTLPADHAVLLKNPKYISFNLNMKSQLLAAYALLADFSDSKKEKVKMLKHATKIFNEIFELDNQLIYKNVFYFTEFLFYASRTGIVLGENSKKKKEQVDYFQKSIIFLLKSLELEFGHSYIENMFLIANTLFKIGKLTNDEVILKKAYTSYIDAIEYCKNRGYLNLVGTAYINIAQIEDRLNNFSSAAENYSRAIEAFEKAILYLSYTKTVKKIEKLKNYLKAWRNIEKAKLYHAKEEHEDAKLYYERASKELNNIKDYKSEAPFYLAWSKLEDAEKLSKSDEHELAANMYLEAKNKFDNAIDNFELYLNKKIFDGDKQRLTKLIEVAKARETYCNARFNIESARSYSRKGEHIHAAELYSEAGILFEQLCRKFKVKREKNELTAIYNLCRAWENLERGETKQDPSLYALAADLFKEAEKMFPESRMKKFSIANSQYCTALQYGILFDNSKELQDKIKFYRKIKMFLRDSSRNYQLGDFHNDAQFSLASSAFFDGLWYLLKYDNEIDLSKKSEHLNVAIYYFESALHMFEKAGYERKKKSVEEYLKIIKEEKTTLISALKIIEKPNISSSVGISAPSCPLEISSSADIKEMQKKDLQAESELNWFQRIHHIYFYLPDGGCIFNRSFHEGKKVSPILVAGGLTGLEALIQEMTQTQTQIKVIEQENMSILLEHGKYVSVALISEENLLTLRKKLISTVRDVEKMYGEELASYKGKISGFSKIDDIVKENFELTTS
ncbi:MAG: tetratricopeptide repeat protein [Candidatus Helarchaeota archaeon]